MNRNISLQELIAINNPSQAKALVVKYGYTPARNFNDLIQKLFLLTKEHREDALKDLVDELLQNGHKALIFSQFVDYLRIIEKEIKKMGVSYQYLDGSTPLKKRKTAIDAFQDGDGDIFLISLKAGGTGLNLTAADYVIHVDPWWNPAVEDQASDRAHRIGQQNPVTVYRLVSEGSIEEKIVKLHGSKREMAEALLQDTDGKVSLNADELLYLIKGF
jgi:SNF2 family DNA or RNA helicase